MLWSSAWVSSPWARGLQITFRQNASAVEELVLFFLFFFLEITVLCYKCLMSENSSVTYFVQIFGCLWQDNKSRLWYSLMAGSKVLVSSLISLVFFAYVSIVSVSSQVLSQHHLSTATTFPSPWPYFGPRLSVSWIIAKVFNLVFRPLDSMS